MYFNEILQTHSKFISKESFTVINLTNICICFTKTVCSMHVKDGWFKLKL